MEWETIKLGSVVDIINGFAFKSSDFTDNGVPVIKIKNVKPQTIKLDDLSYVSDKTVLGKEKWKINYGDILITMSGNRFDGSPDSWVGKVAQFKINGKYFLNQRVSKLVPINSKIDPSFISYLLSSWEYQQELISLANSSGGQANISPEIVKNLQLAIPPLPVQQSIASVLSSLDDKIDLLHRQNKTLEQMAETLFRQWFVEEAQEEWSVDVLENLFDIGIGRTPPRKEQQWFTTNPGDIKWISIKDMGNKGIYIDSTAECLTLQAVEKFNIPVIPTNTVILSFKMTIGRLGITTEEMLSNEAIAHFKLIEGSDLYPEYLYLYLKTFRWEQLGSTSSIVEAINSKMIKDMELVVPPKDRLQKFKTIIESYFLKVRHNQKQLTSLMSTRDLLLPKLMNGSVRVINN